MSEIKKIIEKQYKDWKGICGRNGVEKIYTEMPNEVLLMGIASGLVHGVFSSVEAVNIIVKHPACAKTDTGTPEQIAKVLVSLAEKMLERGDKNGSFVIKSAEIGKIGNQNHVD